MKITKADISGVLGEYDLGELKKLGRIMKDDSVSFGRIIQTSKKKFFLKAFRKFNLSTKQGLNVASKLYGRGYPTYKIYKTKKGRTYTKYRGVYFSLIEYLPIKKIVSWKNLDKEMVKEFSKNLALFHKYSSQINLKKTRTGSFEEIKNLIIKSYILRSRYDKNIQKAIIFMKENIDKLKCRNGERKDAYFSEFNPGHVLFKNKKVWKVIDWEIGYDYRYYDISSSLIACFNQKNNKIDLDKIKEFISSYDKLQKLSKWEKQHFYEAILFGVFKYGVWGLINIKSGYFAKDSKDIDKGDVSRINEMMKLDKNKFLELLK